MSSSTSVAAPLTLRHGCCRSPATHAQSFLSFPNHSSRLSPRAPVRASSPPQRLLVAAAASSGERDNRVQELRVPDSWLTPAGAAQKLIRSPAYAAAVKESEWLRETLHKWLDDEYCPEPANVDISSLMKMIGDLEKLSYRESFHGAFSAANAAVRLITQRMESLPGDGV